MSLSVGILPKPRLIHVNKILRRLKYAHSGGINMKYTIDQLLDMDFETVSDKDLTNILEFVNTHYFEDQRYSELLEEIKFEQEVRTM
jgi:hypothetical protein